MKNENKGIKGFFTLLCQKKAIQLERLKLAIYLCWRLYGYLSFLIMLQKKDGAAIDNIRQQ